MSSTILHELLAVRRTLTTRYQTDSSDEEREFDVMVLSSARVELLQESRQLDRHTDAVRVLRGSLPYRRWCEASERENDAWAAAGGRAICPQCGERSLKDRTVCTLGYPGHPGADYSALYECESCDYSALAG